MKSARAKLLSKRMKKGAIPLLDFTPATDKRLATHKRLLAQVVTTRDAHKVAVAVAKALSQLAESAAINAQSAQRKAEAATKRFNEYDDKRIPATAKVGRIPSAAQRTMLLERLERTTAQATAAVDAALAFCDASNRRIVRMGRKRRNKDSTK